MQPRKYFSSAVGFAAADGASTALFLHERLPLLRLNAVKPPVLTLALLAKMFRIGQALRIVPISTRFPRFRMALTPSILPFTISLPDAGDAPHGDTSPRLRSLEYV